MKEREKKIPTVPLVDRLSTNSKKEENIKQQKQKLKKSVCGASGTLK